MAPWINSLQKERLYIYDTTLRDGQQTQGVQFSTEEKIEIAEDLITPQAEMPQARIKLAQAVELHAANAQAAAQVADTQVAPAALDA